MSKPHVILCFGDSNTWGYDPATQDRFPPSIRWTGRLQQGLGPGYQIIEEGLNGRTTIHKDPIKGYRNGKDYLLPCLDSHHPVDRVLLLLGTNDLKAVFKQTTEEIANGVQTLAKMILASDCGPENRAPQLTLMAPPPLAKLTSFDLIFRGGPEKSRNLGARYAELAAKLKCDFLDLGTHIQSSDIDGIHWEADAHTSVAEVLTRMLRVES